MSLLSRKRLCGAGVSLAVAAGLTAGASPASAAPGDPGCRASAARVTAAGSTVASEPIRANDPTTPCTPQSSVTVAPATAGPAQLAAGRAVTDVGAGPTLGALASADVTRLSLTGVQVGVQAAQATALAACGSGTTTRSGSSRVAGLTVNGRTVALPSGDAPFRLDLGPLGSVSVNETTDDGTTLTRRAVVVRTPEATAVIAEAIAGGDACRATVPGSGSGSGPADGGVRGTGDLSGHGICAVGSTYDAPSGMCVIPAGAFGGLSEGTITVGRPFEGPRGGRLVPLSVARKRYKSACLSGRGPKYAVIGTKRRDRITGTNHADRILALAGRDSVDGGRGNDCVDGGSGRDLLMGALGKDRLHGGAGHDGLNGASGHDRLYGGAGPDDLVTGHGGDRVKGGSGRDSINATNRGPAASVNCGSGRDVARVNPNERRKARHCERIRTVR